ncbi:MAG: POTRA domain-containing protein, partial [Cyclobacteriaceae bacterium]
MKRILIPLFLVCIASVQSAQGQFRRNREPATPALSENSLNYANPVEYLIGGIEVKGLNVLDKNAMISLTGLKIGDKVKIPGDKISGAIRKLWKHGLVGDATIEVERIEGQNVFLVIVLAERPRLNDFYFTGISGSKQSSLKEELTLIRGKIVNDAMIRNTELSVKKFFSKKGFLNTQVKVIQEQDTLNRGGVKVRIDVDLKQKVRINEIIFEGNENVSSGKLKKRLKKTKEHARISLHRTIIKNVLSLTPKKIRESKDSSYAVDWSGIKEFVNRNIKLNVF